MGIFDGPTKHVQLVTPAAAQYGKTTPYPGGNNAVGARDEAWGQGAHNDTQQGQVDGAQKYANDAAKTGKGWSGADQNAGAAANQAGRAGGNQAGAIELARRMAMGSQPSQAAMQMQSGLNQATAQQRAIGGSARGGAAMATAQSNQLANTANLQQNAYTAAGMLKGQEMAAGRGLYGSMAQDSRGQDAAALAEANRMGQANAKSYDDYRMGMDNAGVQFGGVGLGQQGSDLDNFNRGMNPIYAQDDMNQQQKEWLYEDRRNAAASNKEEAD